MTDLVIFMKSSGAKQFSYRSINYSYKKLSRWITAVDSAQGTTMAQRKPFGPCRQCICLIAVRLIVGPASISEETAWSSWLWTLPFRVFGTGRLYLNMLRMVISEFAKGVPAQTVQIPPPEEVAGMTYDEIDATLWFGAPMLACFIQYLRNT